MLDTSLTHFEVTYSLETAVVLFYCMFKQQQLSYNVYMDIF